MELAQSTRCTSGSWTPVVPSARNTALTARSTRAPRCSRAANRSSFGTRRRVPLLIDLQLKLPKNMGGTNGETGRGDRSLSGVQATPSDALQRGIALDRQKTAGALVRPGMQVTPSGGNTGMSEGGLHQVNGRAVVEGVGGVRMAEPVRRNRQLNAGAPGRQAHDPQHGQGPRTPPPWLLRERNTGSSGSAWARLSSLTSFQTEPGIRIARVIPPFPSTVSCPPSRFGCKSLQRNPHNSLTRIPEA